MAHKLRHSQAGYTLLELLIASMVFSVILLGAAGALIHVGRMYYKGVITSRTQGIARSVMDDIARSIQFSGDTVTSEFTATYGGIDVHAFCVGSTRYTYALNAQVNDSVTTYEAATHRLRHGLWKDTVTSAANCVDESSGNPVPNLTLVQPTVGRGGQELLDQHMRLGLPSGIDAASYNMVTPNGQQGWNVRLVTIYGDDDVLQPDATNPTACKALIVNAQWCAVSPLSTTVQKRLQAEG